MNQNAPASAWSPRLLRRWPVGAAIVGVLLLGAASWLALGRFSPPPPPRRMAILPLEVVRSDPAAQTLADGVVERVTAVVNANSIETVLPEAAATLRGADRDHAARAIGVGYILGGQVRREGDAYHVGIYLDDPAGQTRLWSLGFDRPAAKLPGFPEEVARTVSDALNCAFSARTQKDVRLDGPTLAAFIKACATDNPILGRDLLKKIIQREPRLAAARSTLGAADVGASDLLPASQSAAVLAEARAMALSAIALNPHDGHGYAVLAFLPSQDDWAQHEKYLLAGLAADPDEQTVNMGQARLLEQVGRTGEALAYAQHGSLISPIEDHWFGIIAKIMLQDGRAAQANAGMEHAATIWPDSNIVRGDRFFIALFGGEPERALSLLNDPATRPTDMEASDLDAWRAVAGALVSKSPDAVRAAGRKMTAAAGDGSVDLTHAVHALAALGLVDEAFDLIEHPPNGQSLFTAYLFYPDEAALRRDPQFMPLAARLGLVDFWRRFGKWPDFCQAPNRPYDCRAVAAALPAAAGPATPSAAGGIEPPPGPSRRAPSWLPSGQAEGLGER